MEFFLIALIVSLLQNIQIVSKYTESVDLSSNTFYDNILEGTNILTFRLKRDDSSSSFFKIEFASEPLIKEESFITIAYEKNTDTPQYVNDTNLILNKEYIEQGKRIIIVQQPDAEEEYIIISFFKKGEENINFVVKYATLSDPSSFPSYILNEDNMDGYILNEDSRYVDISFIEINTEAESCTYLIYLYQENQFENVATINTIALEPSSALSKTSIKGNCAGGKIKGSINKPENFSSQLYINIVTSFTTKNGKNERIAYKMVKIKKNELINQDEEHLLNVVSFEKRKTVRLRKTMKEHQYYYIEYSAPIAEYDEKPLSIVAEKYKDTPKYEKDIEYESVFSQGKTILKINYQDEEELDIYFSVILQDDSISRDFGIYYLSSMNIEDFPIYSFDENVTAIYKGGSINITFTEILKEKTSYPSHYYFCTTSAFNHNIDTLNTIFTQDYLYEIVEIGEDDGKNKKWKTIYPYWLNEEHDNYLNIIGEVYFPEKKRKVKLAYKLAKIIPYEPSTLGIFHKEKFDIYHQKDTYLLENNNLGNIYEIEIAQNFYLLNSSDCQLQFSYEEQKKWPTYKNSTSIQLIQDENKNGKIKIKLKTNQPNQSILISFFLNEKEDASYEKLLYSFKYKIYQESQPIEEYKYEPSFSVSIFYSKLTVSFYEIQYNKEDTNTINYKIYVYSKELYPNKDQLNTIIESNNYLYSDSITGSNPGEKLSKQYLNYTSLFPYESYFMIIATIIKKNGEEEIIGYDVVEPYSYTTIFIVGIILGVLLLIAIVGIIIFIFRRKKRFINQNSSNYISMKK